MRSIYTCFARSVTSTALFTIAVFAWTPFISQLAAQKEFQRDDLVVTRRGSIPVMFSRKQVGLLDAGEVLRILRIDKDEIKIQTAKFSGYIKKRDVIKLDKHADDFFKGQLETNYYARGVVLFELERYPEASENFDAALRLNQKNAKASRKLAVSLVYSKRYKDAIAEFDRAFRLGPKTSVLLHYQGMAYSGLDKEDKAIDAYTLAINIGEPEYAIYANRGQSYESLGKYDNAISDYNLALKLAPKLRIAIASRGYCYHQIDEYEKAISDYEYVLKLDPEYSFALNHYAWLLSTCKHKRMRNGKRAVKLAKSACDLSKWKNYDHLDTLAAAYAENGEFEDAIKYQLQAINLAKDKSVSKRNSLDYRLAQYKKKLAIRSQDQKKPPGKIDLRQNLKRDK